ncbi:MAG: plastocyanin/azurin family copper-binding protein [Microthrixaceae bacterium]
MAADETTTTGDGTSHIMYGEGQAAWLALVTVLAFGALILAIAAFVMASDDSGGGGGGAAAPAADAAPATELSIATSEFAFDPENAAVVADEDVTVTLDNSGAVEHNWTVLKAGTTIGAESEFTDSMVEAAVGDVAAGETLDDVINLPEGDYQVICSVAGHFDAGMKGQLAVGGAGA